MCKCLYTDLCNIYALYVVYEMWLLKNETVITSIYELYEYNKLSSLQLNESISFII